MNSETDSKGASRDPASGVAPSALEKLAELSQCGLVFLSALHANVHWNPHVNGAPQSANTARGRARVLRRTGILSVRWRDIGRVAPAASFSSALGATPDAGSLLAERDGDRQQLGAASR